MALPTDVKTLWTYNVPEGSRTLLAAAFPEIDFRFISIHGAAEQDRWRIVRSPGPALALWGDRHPGDLWRVAGAERLRVFQICAGPLALPGATGSELVPLGYGMVAVEETPLLPGRRFAAGDPATRSAVPAALLEEGTRGLAAFLERGLTTYTHKGAQLASMPKPEGRPGPRVVVVAEERTPLHVPVHEPKATLAELVRRARADNPEAFLVLLLNAERAQGGRLRTAIGDDAVALADEVVGGFYHPSVLRTGDRVYTLSGMAGLDALARGLDLVCLGTPLYARALPGDPGRMGLGEVFARYFLDGTRYVDPATGQRIALSTALDLVAERTPADRRIAVAMPEAAAPAAPPSPEATPTDTAAAPRATKEPKADQKPKADQDPKAGQDLKAGKEPKAPKAQKAAKASAPVEARPGLEPFAQRFATPNWLQTEELLSTVTLGPGMRRVVALSANLAPHATALHLLGLLGASENDLRPRASVPQEVIDAYAETVPDVFQNALRLRLKSFDPDRTVLLVGGLDSIAMRLVARVARDVGIPRLHAPVIPYASTGPFAGRVAAEARDLDSLADYLIAWHPSHLAHARTVGFPAERLLPWSPAQEATGGRDTLLVILAAPEPEQEPAHGETLRGVLTSLTQRAEVFGIRAEIVASPACISLLGAEMLEVLFSSPGVRFTAADDIMAAARVYLPGAAVVISDDPATLSLAAALAIPSIHILGAEPAEEMQADTAWDAESLGRRLRQSLDEAQAAAPPPLDDRSTLWARLQEGGDLVCLPSPGAQLLQGKPSRFGLLGSNAPREVFEQTQKYVLEMLGFRDVVRVKGGLGKIGRYGDVDAFAIWGIRASKTKGELSIMARALNRELIIIEDGFVRSIQIGLSGEPGLAVLLDDATAYYDATRASQLEQVLNGESRLTTQEVARARRLIARIHQTKVTKYNFAPYTELKVGRPGRPKILLVDQRFGDQSVTSGLADERSFALMLETAMSFADTHDILVKTHPDRNIGGKEGYFTDDVLARYAGSPDLFLVEQDMNPFSAIDVCEKVFVVTSGMGFEALIAGREVWCFGAPFYSNWGATIDMVRVQRREARRSVEEIFHFSYLVASRYYSPDLGRRCELEELVDYIVGARPFTIDPAMVDANVRHGGSSRTRGMPRRKARQEGSVATAVAESLAPPTTTVAVGFSKWKRRFLPSYFPDRRFVFLEPDQAIEDVREFQNLTAKPEIMVWGIKSLPGMQALAARRGLKVCRVEDGFLRSVGLGSEYRRPYSLCLDYTGIYFDATRPSDLERILQTYDFHRDERLMEVARLAIEHLVRSGLSKYNFPRDVEPEAVYGPKKRKRVLVVGQVEDDASILLGAPKGITNNDLVRLARSENPGAQVIYKIHPDVLAQKRASFSDPADVRDLCEVVATRMPLADALHQVDHVYTITSLAGFEALVHGAKVTAVGAPFYTGWGLADERMRVERRGRTLSLEEVFAAAYLLYPTYFEPATGARITLDETLDRIQTELAQLPVKSAA